jgi:hypothetical protein
MLGDIIEMQGWTQLVPFPKTFLVSRNAFNVGH